MEAIWEIIAGGSLDRSIGNLVNLLRKTGADESKDLAEPALREATIN